MPAPFEDDSDVTRSLLSVISSLDMKFIASRFVVVVCALDETVMLFVLLLLSLSESSNVNACFGCRFFGVKRD